MRGVNVTVGRNIARVEQPEPPVEGPEVFVPDPDYAECTDEDVAAEYEKVRVEYRRRLAMVEAAEGAARALVSYQAAQGVSDGTVYRPPAGYLDAVPPGGRRVFKGNLYENTSGQPVVRSPGEAPELWTLVEEGVEPVVPDPGDYPEWAPDMDLEVGDVVAYDGVLWEVATAHRSQIGWEPHDGYMWRRV